jgi:hypothetical protein
MEVGCGCRCVTVDNIEIIREPSTLTIKPRHQDAFKCLTLKTCVHDHRNSKSGGSVLTWICTLFHHLGRTYDPTSKDWTDPSSTSPQGSCPTFQYIPLPASSHESGIALAIQSVPSPGPWAVTSPQMPDQSPLLDLGTTRPRKCFFAAPSWPKLRTLVSHLEFALSVEAYRRPMSGLLGWPWSRFWSPCNPWEYPNQPPMHFQASQDTILGKLGWFPSSGPATTCKPSTPT